MKELLRAFAAAHPERAWLRGAGWDQSLFPGGLPTKALIDAVVPDRPVSLAAGDGGHTLLVNSLALERAGIDRDTPAPPRGEIVRDADGEPTGVLREAATDLIAPHLPPRTDDELDAGLRRGLAELARVGVTSFQEARAGDRIAASYGRLDARGELTARVRLALHVPAEEITEDDTRLLFLLTDAREELGSPHLCAGSVKLFLDGVIEGRTAALLEPYVGAGAASGRGPTYVDPELLASFVTTLDAAGFQVHMHAIGDRAVRDGLDAVAAARTANGPRDARHHLAHVQLVDPADLPRFAELGVAANIQALWAYADGYITELTEPVLGPQRSRWLYPFASLRDAGAVLVGGSDWPVTSADPLEAIQVALTRRPPEAPDAPAWLPEQRLALGTAIAMYTRDGAWLDFHEDRAGSITEGKLADFVLLERDLFAIPPEEIGAVRVLWTVFEGRELHRAADMGPPARAGSAGRRSE
jgi:hypothetical protein